MATHYRGQRIDELLNEIAKYEGKLKHHEPTPEIGDDIAKAWTALALAKAKLTALQGEDK